MVVYSPATVLELLDHNPLLQVYQYTLAGTQQVCYAIFELEAEYAYQLVQQLPTAVLLCQQGQLTDAGIAWVVEHGRKGTGHASP